MQLKQKGKQDAFNILLPVTVVLLVSLVKTCTFNHQEDSLECKGKWNIIEEDHNSLTIALFWKLISNSYLHTGV